MSALRRYSIVIGVFVGLSCGAVFAAPESAPETAPASGGIAEPVFVAGSMEEAAAGPVISVWYGKRQTFKRIGTSQRWANILGNITAPGGIKAVSYTLNAGAAKDLSLGPDEHRLVAAGDFNIDLLYSTLKLLPDSNRIVITAEDNSSVIARDTVIVRVVAGMTWPTTYSVRWSSASSLTDSAQVVDGAWSITPSGLSVTQPGYDRLVAIGDTSWQDYEVTVPITVHSLDPSGYNPISAYPSVGILMRWAGHTNDPVFTPPITQPLSGYNPFGAIAYYSWRDATDERLEMFGNGAVRATDDISGKKIAFDVPTTFKVRVRNTPSGPFYSFKVWTTSESEPVAWDLSYQARTTDPLRGSFMLVAHHVYATFGRVTVTPVAPDLTPPTLSGIGAFPGSNSVTIQWTTNEPATSVVEFGPNTSYGSTVSQPALVVDHKVTLVGLPENSTAHYRVTSVDGGANSTTSADYTFTTSTAPKVISDTFDGPGLNTSLWTTVNPFGDGQISVTGTQLAIQVPGGTAHDAWSGANNTVRVMQPTVDADFQIEAKFTGPMTTEYQISGMFIEQDAQNYVRLDFNSDGINTRVFAAKIVGNVATAVSGFDDVVAPAGTVPLYMRVNKERNTFTLLYSLDGVTWVSHLQFSAPIVANAVGLFAGNSGATPPAFTMQADYFKGNLPPAPAQLLPVNLAVNQPTTVSFAWNRYTTPCLYHLQAGQDSLFAGSLTVNDSSITDTVRSFGGFLLDRMYYWRVKAKVGGLASAFSPVRRFSTVMAPPPAPALVSPVNGEVNRPVPVRLTWRKVPFALSYGVQVATDSTFAGGIAMTDTTLTDSTVAAGGLAYQTTYYWRVYARGPGGNGPYSTPWRFTTSVAPPATPLLVSPADGAGSQPIPAPVVWRSVANVSSYHLQVATTPGFASGVITNDSTLTDTLRVLPSLQSLTTYYWRVRALGPGGASAFSAGRAFTTQVNAPVPVSPGNNSIGQPTSITFQWRKVPTATRYWLQLSADSAFGTLLRNDTTITDSSRFVAGLVINTRYYWRVAARDPSGWGQFSVRWTFLTGTPTADQVLLVSPAHQQLIFADSARLVWRKSQPLVDRYWLEIAGDSLFSFKQVDSLLTDTTSVRRQLVLNQSYFWRVRAGNPGGWGPFSETRRFSCSPPLSVDDLNGIPSAVALRQNYPNPFNPATTVEFALPAESAVRLEVFTLLGQRIQVLAEGTYRAGYHRIRFDAGNLPSGVYLYRLSAGSTVILKRMSLVR